MEVNDWEKPSGMSSVYYIFPRARADIIRGQNLSKDQQCSLASSYYVTVYPLASWHNLADILYQTGQPETALDAFRAQLPKLKGKSNLNV